MKAAHPTRRRWQRALALPLTVGLVLTAIVPVALAQNRIRFNAPDLRAPGNREAGASRGDVCMTEEPTLTALIPQSNLSLTTQAYPDFFVYLPPNTAKSLVFVLYDNDTGEETYRTSFSPLTEAGVVAISLPDNGIQKPIEVGHRYTWYFAVMCDTVNLDRNFVVSGELERVEPSDRLTAQLDEATAADLPEIYAEHGLWSDVLTSLVSQRRQTPQSQALLDDWIALLESVNLADVADKPLLPISLDAEISDEDEASEPAD